MAEKILRIGSPDDTLAVLGSGDENIRAIEEAFGVTAVCRDPEIRITGDAGSVRAAAESVSALLHLWKSGIPIDQQGLQYCISLAESGNAESAAELAGNIILTTEKGNPVRPKTLGQKAYTDAITSNEITFGIGPAGTGKTYLAVAMAVASLKAHKVSRIILTRPAVEAGERLGFLPGDLQNKIDPYLRPLYDGLFEMLGSDAYQKMLEKGSIEIAPLAYMRGRTLDSSFIILDEAQNTTPEQMKMFLTRMGLGSRVVINGDVTQIDLPDSARSGLVEAERILKGIEGIACVRLNERDVVRHPLVRKIILAYEKSAAETARKQSRDRAKEN